MRNLVMVASAVAVVACIVSFNLWRELRVERAQLISLRDELAASRVAGSLAPPAAPPVAVASQPEVTAGVTPAVAAASSPSSAAPAPPAPQAAPGVATGSAAGTGSPQMIDIAQSMQRQRELLKDPEYRAASLAQTRLTMLQMYEGLAEEVGLTTEETNQLLDLLARHQLEMSENSPPFSATGQAPTESQMQANQQMRQRQQSELSALLGARLPQWQEFQQSLGARNRVAQLGRTLDALGQPLSRDQSRPLIAALAAEQRGMSQRMVESLRALVPPGAASDPQLQAQAQARMREEQLRLQDESNQRVLQTAGSHLNAAQLQAFRSMLESQQAMVRASQRVQGEAGLAVQGVTIDIQTGPGG